MPRQGLGHAQAPLLFAKQLEFFREQTGRTSFPLSSLGDLQPPVYEACFPCPQGSRRLSVSCPHPPEGQMGWAPGVPALSTLRQTLFRKPQVLPSKATKAQGASEPLCLS